MRDYLDRICSNCEMEYGTHRTDDDLCSLTGHMDWPTDRFEQTFFEERALPVEAKTSMEAVTRA